MGDFSGVFFGNRVLPAKGLGMFSRAVLTDGILTGFGLSSAGAQLTVEAGYMIACGRVFQLPQAKTLTIGDASSGYARVIVEIDLTAVSTPTTFDQVRFAVDYASTVTGFAALTQADVNAAGTIYQTALCIVSLGTAGITGVVSAMAPAMAARLCKLLWTNASPTSAFAAQTISIDLSGYASIMTVFAYATTVTGRRGTQTQLVDDAKYAFDAPNESESGLWCRRDVTAAATGVVFGGGGYFSADAGFTANNIYAIPLYIYGIKGVM